MPALIRFMLQRLSIGFALGAGTAVALAGLDAGAIGYASQPLAILLMIYGLGSTFALGYLGTALAMEDES
jgi:hypothetical protein